jgi:Carboxypeptidase regulatory-like domain
VLFAFNSKQIPSSGRVVFNNYLFHSDRDHDSVRTSDVSTRGPVQAAEVVITSLETNLSFREATNGSGLCVLSALKPDRYRITVTKGGFRAVDLTDVLNVQDSISPNFKLQVGSVSKSIMVAANGINLNASDASVSTTVDRQFFENIPVWRTAP